MHGGRVVTHRIRMLAGLLAAGLVVGACSSDDAEGKDPTGTSRRGAERAAVAADPSKACGAAAVAPGHEKVTLVSGGTERWYWRDVPPAHDGETPVPVIVDFHGYSEGADVHLVMSSLGEYGNEQGFVTITPQGLGAVARWDTGLDSADQGFVGDLLDQVGETLCIDENRVYAAGLSNGAMMTSAVACTYADRFAAVAPVAGVQDPEGCDPVRPVPVIAFHGTDDGFVAYDGGYGERVASLPAPDGSGKTLGESGVLPEARDRGPSVPETVVAWAKRNGCSPTSPEETDVAADVAKIAFTCPDVADAQLYRVEGGGHTWPGSDFSKQIESVVGPTTFSISANELMWEFFQEHPLRSK